MRNLKKVLAVILTVAMLASFMVPAFAAVSHLEEAKKLQAIGLFAGGEADLKLDEDVTRIQGLTFAIRAAGKEEEALAMTDEEVAAELAKFKDSDTVPSWNGNGPKYVAYAIKNGITVGDGQGNFKPLDKISGRAFLVFLLKTGMGYKDVTTLTAPDVAVEAGILTPSQAMAYAAAESGIIRDDVAAILFGAATNGVNADGTKFIDAYIASGATTKEAAQQAGFVVTPETLAVKSITAPNLKEVIVVFNKPVDVTHSNFMLDGATVLKDNFKLSDDKTTAYLFNAATPSAGKKVKVAVVNVDGLATVLQDVVVNDNALPYVEKVETVGNRLIKVTFSEPMFAGATTISNYKINGLVKSGTAKFSNMNKTVNITLSAGLADGDYELEVNPANVKDFAGNSLGINSTAFSIAKDAAVPGYTVLSATQQTIKIKFDREVNESGADMVMYWKDGSTEHKATGSKSATDPTEWTFTFNAAGRLPVGNNTLKIKKVVDFSGNVKTDYEVTVNAVVDLDRPEFVSLTQKDDTTFEVKFSKKVLINPANYIVKDSKGVSYAIASAAYKSTDDTVVVLTINNLNTTRNPYTLTLKNVVDTTYLRNQASDLTVSFTINDKVAPQVVGNVLRKNQTLSIVFNEDIDQSSFSLANVRYETTPGSGFRDLPSAAYYTFVGTTIVNITFPAKFGPSDTHTAALIKQLYISDVMDLAGNKMIAVQKAVTNDGDTVGYKNGTAYMVDTKTILIEPDRTLEQAFLGDFVVKAGTTVLDIASVELVTADTDVNKYAATDAKVGNPIGDFVAGDQLIKITLDKEVSANAKKLVEGVEKDITVSTVASADVQLTKTPLGAPLSLTNVPVADKIIPSAPVADNFTYNNITSVDVTTSFMTNEPVSVEILAQDNDVTPVAINTARTAVWVEATDAKTYFSHVDTQFAPGALPATPTDGTEVYVRFVDKAGNKTDWVKVGTKVPAAPAATFTFDKAGDNTNVAELASVTTAMEYSLDGGTTWTSITGTTVDLTSSLASISTTNDIKVRVKASGTIPEGKVQTIDIQAAPAAPALVFNTSGGTANHTTIVGSTTAMEYSLQRGGVGAWTPWTKFTAANMELEVSAGDVIRVRVAATTPSPTTAAPAGEILTHTMLAPEIVPGT